MWCTIDVILHRLGLKSVTLSRCRLDVWRARRTCGNFSSRLCRTNEPNRSAQIFSGGESFVPWIIPPWTDTSVTFLPFFTLIGFFFSFILCGSDLWLTYNGILSKWIFFREERFNFQMKCATLNQIYAMSIVNEADAFFFLFQTLFEIIDQWIASRWNDSVKWNNTPYRSLIDSNLRVSMSLRVFFYIINSIWSELRSIVESFHSWDSNFLHSLWGNLFQRIQQLTLSHLIIISRHY